MIQAELIHSCMAATSCVELGRVSQNLNQKSSFIVIKVRSKGGQFFLIGLCASFLFGGVQNILEDRNGNYWFGCSGGLFRLKENRIVNVTKQGPWD